MSKFLETFFGIKKKESKDKIDVDVTGTIQLSIEENRITYALYGKIKFNAVVKYPDKEHLLLVNVGYPYTFRLTDDYYSKLELYEKVYQFVEEGDEEVFKKIKERMTYDISNEIRNKKLKDKGESVEDLLKKPVQLNLTVKIDKEYT